MMALLPLVLTPDPILRKAAEPVEEITDGIVTLAENMAQTMYNARGIGLAANQIGVLKRVIVIDCADKEEAPALWKMINPQISWRSNETSKREEGCLSIPGHIADVTRPAEVHVDYLDCDGQRQKMHATGLLAACVQHEIDHLDGILFIDHLSRLKRNIIWRKIVKDSRAQND